MSGSLRALLAEGIARLQAADLVQARQEAEWLLGHLLGVRPLELYLEERAVAPGQREEFLGLIDSRSGGAPLQYLLGEAEFCGTSFLVAPEVFIPRPETESVVEATVEALRGRHADVGRPLRLLDLGTGSGCIAVSLAQRLPACHVVAVELSWVALRIARQNVLRHGLQERVCLVQGRWLEACRGPIDAIVSNPPYIPAGQVDRLPLDVRREPRLSLDGGNDGLRDAQQVIVDAPVVLQPGGLLVLECGEDQVEPLSRVAAQTRRFDGIRPLMDLAGRPRGLMAARTDARHG